MKRGWNERRQHVEPNKEKERMKALIVRKHDDGNKVKILRGNDEE